MTCEDKINETGHGYHNPAPSTLKKRDNNKITREQRLITGKNLLNVFEFRTLPLDSSAASKFATLEVFEPELPKIYVVDDIFLNFWSKFVHI
jgi:hypothetical protein